MEMNRAGGFDDSWDQKIRYSFVERSLLTLENQNVRPHNFTFLLKSINKDKLQNILNIFLENVPDYTVQAILHQLVNFYKIKNEHTHSISDSADSFTFDFAVMDFKDPTLGHLHKILVKVGDSGEAFYREFAVFYSDDDSFDGTKGGTWNNGILFLKGLSEITNEKGLIKRFSFYVDSDTQDQIRNKMSDTVKSSLIDVDKYRFYAKFWEYCEAVKLEMGDRIIVTFERKIYNISADKISIKYLMGTSITVSSDCENIDDMNLYYENIVDSRVG